METPELAQALDFYQKGTRTGNGLKAFYGRKSIFSNFFPCYFKEGSTSYNCTEQMYQSEKCLFYGDPQAARSVMLQSDPVMMKRIGDRLTHSDPTREKEWLKHRAKSVMKAAVHLKFSQNHNLRNALKQTLENFVEANPHDSIWGIGLSLNNTKLLDREEWKGENWLGDILTDMRDKFLSEEAGQ